jgi:hypothetical protein
VPSPLRQKRASLTDTSAASTGSSLTWRCLRLGVKVLHTSQQCWCGFKHSLLWGFDIALWVLLIWLCFGKQLGLSMWDEGFLLSHKNMIAPPSKASVARVAERVATYARYSLPTTPSCQRVYIRTLHRQSVRVGQTVRYVGLDVGTVQHIQPLFPSVNHPQKPTLRIMWCSDGRYKLALPQDQRVMMANMTLLGGEDLEFLPESLPNVHRLHTENRMSSLQQERLAPFTDPLNWESFRMSDYLELQAEGLLLTEQSLLGIESGVRMVKAHISLLKDISSHENQFANMLQTQVNALSILKTWHQQLVSTNKQFSTYTLGRNAVRLPSLLLPTQEVLRTPVQSSRPAELGQD